MFGEFMMEAKKTENCGAEACGINQYFLTAPHLIAKSYSVYHI